MEKLFDFVKVGLHVVAEIGASERFHEGVRPVDVEMAEEKQKLDDVVETLVIVEGTVFVEKSYNDTCEVVSIGLPRIENHARRHSNSGVIFLYPSKCLCSTL